MGRAVAVFGPGAEAAEGQGGTHEAQLGRHYEGTAEKRGRIQKWRPGTWMSYLSKRLNDLERTRWEVP